MTGWFLANLNNLKLFLYLNLETVHLWTTIGPLPYLAHFRKILEKIVCNRLSDYLEKNELLSKSQYGFRKEHSTVHPMVHFMNKITNALENKLHTIAIFCDLRKAFNSCNHNTVYYLVNCRGWDSQGLSSCGSKIT